MASNFISPAKALGSQFERENNTSVALSFGSSGKIYAQILHGAPYDIFLSADAEKPDLLYKADKAIGTFEYANGRLVLMSSESGLLAKDALLKNQFNRLALANPKLAPYGLAASQTLEKLGLRNTTRSKWALAENIGQAFHFVSSGNAQLGFVAQSQIIDFNNSNNRIWLVPSDYHSPIQQKGALIKKDKLHPMAKKFQQFLLSPPTKQSLTRFGYEVTP